MKKVFLLFIRLMAIIIYPFYYLKKRYLDRLSQFLRTELIFIELRKRNVNLGKRIYIGKRTNIIVDKGAELDIGNNVVIGEDVYLKVKKGARLLISDNVHINKGVRLSSFDSIEIGNDTLIASYCNILDHNHKYDLKSPASPKAYDTAPIKIGKGSWLGTKVQVNKGVIIGEFCVVASNAVVTRDLLDSCVYAGIPAKKIKCLEK